MRCIHFTQEWYDAMDVGELLLALLPICRALQGCDDTFDVDGLFSIEDSGSKFSVLMVIPVSPLTWWVVARTLLILLRTWAMM